MDTIRYKKMDIEKIGSVLKDRGIIAFPTDTVFGLGCLNDKDAIIKIYEAKGRDFNKPLPLMVSNIKMLEDYAYVNGDSKKVLEKFTHGPLTIICWC